MSDYDSLVQRCAEAMYVEVYGGTPLPAYKGEGFSGRSYWLRKASAVIAVVREEIVRQTNLVSGDLGVESIIALLTPPSLPQGSRSREQ